MVLWQLLFLLIVSASFGHCYWPSSCRVSKGCYVWRLSELAKVRSPALCSTFSLPTTFGSLAPSFRSLISFSENLVFQDFKIAPHGSRDWLFGSKLQAGSLCTVLWVDSVSEWSKTPAWKKGGERKRNTQFVTVFFRTVFSDLKTTLCMFLRSNKGLAVGWSRFLIMEWYSPKKQHCSTYALHHHHGI